MLCTIWYHMFNLEAEACIFTKNNTPPSMILNCTQMVPNRHSVGLSIDFSLANHNPAIFLSPQALKNLASPLSRQRALIIPICCTCYIYTITCILISEQPTTTS